MNALITQHIKADGALSLARAEISGIDLNDSLCEQKIGIFHRIYSRHAAEITKEISEAFAELKQEDEKPEVEIDQPAALGLNLSCSWLENPIRTGIFNPTTGKEYILSDYYQDADENKHFNQQEAIEIGERTPGWILETDEYHKALDKALWDYAANTWKENVCNTFLNGYEYLTKVLKYELGGVVCPGNTEPSYVGSIGYSRSSSVSGTYGVYLGFNAQNLYPSNAYGRGYGLQVR